MESRGHEPPSFGVPPPQAAPSMKPTKAMRESQNESIFTAETVRGSTRSPRTNCSAPVSTLMSIQVLHWVLSIVPRCLLQCWRWDVLTEKTTFWRNRAPSEQLLLVTNGSYPNCSFPFILGGGGWERNERRTIPGAEACCLTWETEPLISQHQCMGEMSGEVSLLRSSPVSTWREMWVLVLLFSPNECTPLLHYFLLDSSSSGWLQRNRLLYLLTLGCRSKYQDRCCSANWLGFINGDNMAAL